MLHDDDGCSLRFHPPFLSHWLFPGASTSQLILIDVLLLTSWLTQVSLVHIVLLLLPCATYTLTIPHVRALWFTFFNCVIVSTERLQGHRGLHLM